MTYAGEWLQGIGAGYDFLTSVPLDLDALRPSKLDYDPRAVSHWNVLPLLHLLWRGDNSHCSATFVPTRRVPSELSWRPGDWHENAAILNNILHALAVTDTLNIKRHASLHHHMLRIEVQYHLQKGYVAYSNTRGWDWLPERRRFEISDEGRQIRWAH